MPTKSIVNYDATQLQDEVRQREAQIQAIKQEVQADNADNLQNPLPLIQQITA